MLSPSMTRKATPTQGMLLVFAISARKEKRPRMLRVGTSPRALNARLVNIAIGLAQTGISSKGVKTVRLE